MTPLLVKHHYLQSANHYCPIFGIDEFFDAIFIVECKMNTLLKKRTKPQTVASYYLTLTSIKWNIYLYCDFLCKYFFHCVLRHVILVTEKQPGRKQRKTFVLSFTILAIDGGYQACSCRLGFSSMGRNDKSTLFFDGSNW